MKKLFLSSLALCSLVALILPVARAGEIDRTTIKVTASTWEQKAKGGWADNPPEQSLDGNLKTAWMAEGDGVWIQYDFGSVQALQAVKLAFAAGDKRVYTFDILVSETGLDNTWTTVADKAKNTGTSLNQESFAFPTAHVRYVRIVGHGNTNAKFAKWCNITEAAFVTE
jgi:hypothetical protein